MWSRKNAACHRAGCRVAADDMFWKQALYEGVNSLTTLRSRQIEQGLGNALSSLLQLQSSVPRFRNFANVEVLRSWGLLVNLNHKLSM